jgi:RNA polymerase sigma-19 factor, ECF subfamily
MPDLMSSFIEGKELAFNEVYEEYFERIYVFVFRLINNEAEAEDITIQAFYKLFKLHQNFESIENIRAFLYVTSKNDCFNYLKYIQRLTVRQKVFVAQTEDDQDLENNQIEGEKMAVVYQSLERLPDQCRRVLEMIYIEGRKYREVADQLEISVETVKSYRTYAIKKLRKVLSEKHLVTAWISCLSLMASDRL